MAAPRARIRGEVHAQLVDDHAASNLFASDHAGLAATFAIPALGG